MFSKWTYFVIGTIINVCFGCFLSMFPEFQSYQVRANLGKPLILTQLIEADKIKLARNKSYVKPLMNDVESYSGFFTVNKQYNSNLFFWFFPAENNSKNAPVVLWLEGGPGTTSLFATFFQNGPFYITEQQTLKSRFHTWVSTNNVIYIDNPVGTGYSFTNNDKGYSRNQEDVGNNLYKAMIQFFQMFPEYQQNDFFITGESYAGKFVPALAYTIHTRNPHAKLKINLKGLAIGNGWIDPEHMMNYSDYLYQIGLIDNTGKAVIKKIENEVVFYIKKNKWIKAFNTFRRLFDLSTSAHKQPSIFEKLTGFSFVYNFLLPSVSDNSKFEYFSEFVQTVQFREALHLGDAIFHNETKVFEMMMIDIMQSVKPWVEVLLENYRVLMYSGQLDIIVAYPLTVGFHQTLNWTGSEDYRAAERKKWYVDGTLAGYIKTAKNFTEALVRNAGHVVLAEQPLWALDLISHFIHNEPF